MLYFVPSVTLWISVLLDTLPNVLILGFDARLKFPPDSCVRPADSQRLEIVNSVMLEITSRFRPEHTLKSRVSSCLKLGWPARARARARARPARGCFRRNSEVWRTHDEGERPQSRVLTELLRSHLPAPSHNLHELS
jgi:hypothetical protein